MSELTPQQKLHEALAEYLRSQSGGDPYLQTWFVGIGYMRSDVESRDGIAHSWRYITSDGDPFSAYGIGSVALADLMNDMNGGPY